MKTNLLTTAIAFLLGMGIQQNAHADLKDGLVAHWSFDDCRATDNSGNGHDGTLNGNPQCVDGVKGKAFSFDGVDDFIEIIPKSGVSSIGDFSISVWTNLSDFKKQISNKRDRQYIFDGHTNSKTTTSDFYRQGFGLIYDGDSNGNAQEIHNFIHYDDSHILEQNTPFTVKGKWVYLTFIRQGNADYTYVDGKLIESTYIPWFQSKQDSPLDMQHNWFIGTFSGNNLNYSDFNYSFDGSLDDLRIYNRALTEAEVLELYNGNQTSGTVDLSTALVGNSTVKINQNMTYTATASNIGNTSANNVILTLHLPPRVVKISSAPENCEIRPLSVVCSVGTLASGASVSKDITLSFNRAGGASLSSSVRTSDTDSNKTNNNARVITSIKKITQK